ncbi:cytochrome C oxidase subunit IV family protein [Marivirga harenae]|uniref:cytochrome C oxidase subunit IV family protein n=1 Tax=Marivirga harenae TaxID=2010992 RepID=UPI0026E0820A|nr:cytochrome C oxidase subunit IV family protein [Marivirga harenae]WKV12953.1 cytochrome C oxidase subunit IV family protein [Marivirga harenae]|tara:strand:+ start:67485 stop:67739 length:255 start_codon:yes stop_codon:yes gene_type:complete
MKRLTFVYIALIILTILSTYLSGMEISQMWIPAVLVMLLAVFKFILVVLEYMEMRQAHGIWKFGVIFLAVISAMIVGIFGGVQL